MKVKCRAYSNHYGSADLSDVIGHPVVLGRGAEPNPNDVWPSLVDLVDELGIFSGRKTSIWWRVGGADHLKSGKPGRQLFMQGIGDPGCRRPTDKVVTVAPRD